MTGCGGDIPGPERGRQLFSDPNVSTSTFNAFACATCHLVSATASPASAGAESGRVDPGYNLFNAVHRPSWWGSYETRLLDSINYCVTEFMGGRALVAEDVQARALYEYLNQNSPDNPSPPLDLTVIRNVTTLSTISGDPGRGRDVVQRSCQRCHGALHTGNGRLSSRVSIVPEDTINNFPANARAVIIEKIRHGKFFNIGGVMPLYSAESISDPQIADVVTYLGL